MFAELSKSDFYLPSHNIQSLTLYCDNYSPFHNPQSPNPDSYSNVKSQISSFKDNMFAEFYNSDLLKFFTRHSRDISSLPLQLFITGQQVAKRV